MQQPSLFEVASEPPVEQALTCAFGEPWMGPHPLCEAHTDEACAAFDRDVAAGKYDAQGYAPNERKAQQRRQEAKP